MVKSLFVGNLPWAVTDADLKNKFSEFGSVISARVMTDKLTNRSRGFGFVDVKEENVQNVIKSMNGYKWSEREIIVNEARPRK